MRTGALKLCYYIEETFHIPLECIDVVYSAGNMVYGDNAGTANPGPDNPASPRPADYGRAGGATGSSIGRRGAENKAPGAAMMISVPSLVFGGHPTPLMPAFNYHLARQMAKDHSQVDIDVYERNHCAPLPNSVNSATGRFVTPLTAKELQNLDANGIDELSKQPMAEDSLIMPHQNPEAMEWFTEAIAEFGTEQRQQNGLRKLMLQRGWEVPPCIRRWQGLRLCDKTRLEVYRVLCQFYAWIGASHSQIQYIVNAVDRRNPIGDSNKLNAIVAFAVENPWFAGCEHDSLKRFCPSGECYMSGLIQEYENPSLFNQT